MHANFIAKPKGDTRHAFLSHKRFFAELKIGPEGNENMSCVSCIKMDPGVLILKNSLSILIFVYVILSLVAANRSVLCALLICSQFLYCLLSSCVDEPQKTAMF